MPNMIVIRDLPGFDDIEAKARLSFNPNIPTTPEFDRAVDDLSRRTFGTTAGSVWEEFEKFEDVMNPADLPNPVQAFETAVPYVENSDDDAVEFLRKIGIDFGDERGWPLLSTRFFKWQALAARAGMLGRVPDVEEAGLSRFASNLEAEAKRFTSQRPKR